MKPKLLLFLTLLLLPFTPPIAAQNPFRVMFYNVENLFDTLDNPDKEDDEFTPDGIRHWNNYRYYNKLYNIAKTISALGGWKIPALIGLCEVENEKVVHDLTHYSPLRKMQYRHLVTDSPDERGINVALLYQRDQFKYLYHNSLQILFPDNPEKKTRDILHATGQILTGDTLDIFVCHLPSRRNGQLESEPDRLLAASILRAAADSLQNCRLNPNILIMGDFNDEPADKSLSQVLAGNTLHNLFLPLSQHSRTGSYKYRDQWNFLDQIFISENLLNPQAPFHVLKNSATIFQAPFLLTEDKTNGGQRPLKTFHGWRYEGGYSDHLPVFVDFEIR
jgi:endonuclease/exonuclease/phosphatase family metal-dependent hydrolase